MSATAPIPSGPRLIIDLVDEVEKVIKKEVESKEESSGESNSEKKRQPL